MPVSAIVSVALAIAAKAPAIYEDLKFLIETIASGATPTEEQLQKVRDIINQHEIKIDNA